MMKPLRPRTAASQRDQLEVGGAALFLASDLASAVTGETLYVDCGYNVMGY